MREFWLVNGTLVRWHCLPEHAVWPTDDATFGCNGGVRACPDPRTGEGRPTQREAKGVRLGRPRVFVCESQIEALRASGTPWRAIAKELGVCLNNSCRNSAHENVIIVETRLISSISRYSLLATSPSCRDGPVTSDSFE